MKSEDLVLQVRDTESLFEDSHLFQIIGVIVRLQIVSNHDLPFEALAGHSLSH